MLLGGQKIRNAKSRGFKTVVHDYTCSKQSRAAVKNQRWETIWISWGKQDFYYFMTVPEFFSGDHA